MKTTPSSDSYCMLTCFVIIHTVGGLGGEGSLVGEFPVYKQVKTVGRNNEQRHTLAAAQLWDNSASAVSWHELVGGICVAFEFVPWGTDGSSGVVFSVLYCYNQLCSLTNAHKIRHKSHVSLTTQVRVAAARCRAKGVKNTEEFGHKHGDFVGTVPRIGVLNILQL